MEFKMIHCFEQRMSLKQIKTVVNVYVIYYIYYTVCKALQKILYHKDQNNSVNRVIADRRWRCPMVRCDKNKQLQVIARDLSPQKKSSHTLRNQGPHLHIRQYIIGQTSILMYLLNAI